MRSMLIFLIDDEYISNFINRKLIENINPSLQTIEFNDPEEAFDKIQVIKPDLIFLDINMPIMSGWDFLDKMDAEAINSKVVVLTSSVNTIDRNMATKYKNVIGYIEKPATLASISPIITQLLTAVA